MSRFDNNCLWITAGVNDGRSVPVLIGEVGRQADPGHLVLVVGLDPDAADHPAQFASVQLFHTIFLLHGLSGPRPRGPVPGAKEGAFLRAGSVLSAGTCRF